MCGDCVPAGFSAIVFGFLVPLVLTQALLSVRDQEQASHSITVAGALAPLMALIFALLVVCAAYAWSYETPFQVWRSPFIIRVVCHSMIFTYMLFSCASSDK